MLRLAYRFGRVPVLLLFVTAAMVFGSGQPAVADPDLPDIPKHRHYVVKENGTRVEVGPRVCENPSLQGAFNQFHSNVHVHVANSPGPVPSAPGLHNGEGPEIIGVFNC